MAKINNEQRVTTSLYIKGNSKEKTPINLGELTQTCEPTHSPSDFIRFGTFTVNLPEIFAKKGVTYAIKTVIHKSLGQFSKIYQVIFLTASLDQNDTFCEH